MKNIKTSIKFHFKRCNSFFVNNKKITLIILVSLILKLVLMPFFAHADFFSMSRRVNAMIIEKSFFAQKLTSVTYTIHILWFYIIKIFNPEMNNILYFTDYSNSTVNLLEYYTIVGKSEVLRFVFFAKILFLFFDYGILLIVYKLIENPKRKIMITAVWAFNPVIIYTTYIFGRYEVIPLFFMALVIYFLKNNKVLKASIFFVVLLFSREIYTMLIPVFLISILYKNKKLNIRECLISAFIVIGLYWFISFLIDDVFSFNSLFFGEGLGSGANKYANIFGINIGFIYPSIIIYVLSSIYFIINGDLSIHNRFCLLSLCYMTAYFMFGGHSAHYVSWVTLVMIILIKDLKHLSIYIFFILSWVVFWLFNRDEGIFSARLAVPLSLRFNNFLHVPTIYNQHLNEPLGLDYDSLLEILKTIYISFMALFLYRSFKNTISLLEGDSNE